MNTVEVEDYEVALPGRPRRQLFTRATALLFAAVVGAACFYAGVRVEKGQVSSTSGTERTSRCRHSRARRCGLAVPRRGCAGSGRRRHVRDGELDQRQGPVRDRRLGQHGQGHAVLGDQGHQKRGRVRQVGPPRRHGRDPGDQRLGRGDAGGDRQRHRSARRLRPAVGPPEARARDRAARNRPSGRCSAPAADETDSEERIQVGYLVQTRRARDAHRARVRLLDRRVRLEQFDDDRIGKQPELRQQPELALQRAARVPQATRRDAAGSPAAPRHAGLRAARRLRAAAPTAEALPVAGSSVAAAVAPVAVALPTTRSSRPL